MKREIKITFRVSEYEKKLIQSKYKSAKINQGILEMAFDDPQLVQDAFLEVGKMLFPNNPTELQDLFVNGLDFVDFDGLTKDEIKAYLKRKELERIREMKLAERIVQEQKRIPSLEPVLDILELIVEWRRDRIHDYYFAYEQENEFEL